MTTPLKYAATGFLSLTAVTLVLWPWLTPEGRVGVVIAALVALPVQVVTFGLLLRFRDRLNGFLAAWVGGMLTRVVVLAVVAVFAVRSGSERAVPMLLALAGFFFALLLLEPLYFRPAAGKTT